MNDNCSALLLIALFMVFALIPLTIMYPYAVAGGLLCAVVISLIWPQWAWMNRPRFWSKERWRAFPMVKRK
jgi:hypothetical protein